MTPERQTLVGYRLARAREAIAEAELLGQAGLMDETLVDLYNDLFDLRQRADYGDLVEFEEQQVDPLMAATHQFVQRAAELLAAFPEGPADA